MEVETIKLKLKRRPNYTLMNEILNFQRYGKAEEISFTHNNEASEISIMSSVEERTKIVDFLRSRNLI